MDYLDPKKESRNRVLLFAGYACIAVAIALTALVLLYQAYGFGVTKKGDVIQNGLAFFSSQPNPANISLNGKLSKYSTDTRIALPSAIYKVQLDRDGYRTWNRTIEIEGGGVQHFDYPFLFPKKLDEKSIKTYAAGPSISTQSPDRKWLVIGQPGSMTNFEVFDVKDTQKQPVSISLPAGIMTKATGPESLELVSWASDNLHLLVEHKFDGRSEFVLIDRETPEQSKNLNETLSSNPTKLTLIDRKFDKYYLFNQPSATLQKASLTEPTVVNVLQRVLAYQSYGSDTILYVTDKGATSGKVSVKLQTGDSNYQIRTLPAGSTYLLDLTKYSNKLYVAAGSTGLNKVYVYKDPIAQINALSGSLPAPIQVLRVNAPNYISFSNSAQFVMAENGTQFGVYDIENKHGYNYTITEPMDPPATHATWMDGNRLTYVSGGKTLIFDYDYNNTQTLLSANSAYLPAFAPDYKYMLTLKNTSVAPQIELTQLFLRVPADR